VSTSEPEPTAEDLRSMSVAELVELARDRDDEVGYDRWLPIGELQRRATGETFATAEALTRSASSRERVLGAKILSQFGYESPAVEPIATLRRRAVEHLIELTDDHSADVVESAISGLGHLGDPRGLVAVLAHAVSPDWSIRETVAQAFPGITGWGGQLELLTAAQVERVIATLIQLGDDENGDVRNWAIFALGAQYEIDRPDVRDLLARHLGDPHDDARDEAVFGLARRRDARAFPFVLAALTPDSATKLVVEAAAYLGDERLLPALEALGDDAWVSKNTLLRDALRACDPAERARLEVYGAALASELERRLADQLGDHLFAVDVGPGPDHYLPQITARWTAANGDAATLTYDLVALVEERLGGDLASAGELFRSDIAEADGAAG
jgi:hypothetical protein